MVSRTCIPLQPNFFSTYILYLSFLSTLFVFVSLYFCQKWAKNKVNYDDLYQEIEAKQYANTIQKNLISDLDDKI